jgi:hypothetical protein
MRKNLQLLGTIALATTAALALGATPALAADVTQTVTAGTRTASASNLTLGSVAYSHAAQTTTGSMTLTADDSTGSNAGWNVTIQSGVFAYTGTSSGTGIAASAFSLTSAAAPAMTAGQAISTTGGPLVPTSPVGTLDTPRKTVQANTSFGNGTYTQALGVSLAIPAQSAAGTYTGTLTTTIAAAP